MKTILSPQMLLISATFVLASVLFPYESVALAHATASANTRVSAQTQHALRFASTAEFVNEYRQLTGRAPLSSDTTLSTYAHIRAESAASEGLFSHLNKAGKNFYQIMSQNGDAPEIACENLSLSYSDSVQLPFVGWKQSPAHHDCMVDERMNRIGVAQMPFDIKNGRQRFITVMIAGS